MSEVAERLTALCATLAVETGLSVNELLDLELPMLREVAKQTVKMRKRQR